MAKRRKDIKQELIDLLGGFCSWCEITEDLHIDHIDKEDKSFTLSGPNLDKKWSVLVKELAKCQILCYTCHKLKTYANGEHIQGVRTESPQVHGTCRSYTKFNCRCNDCKYAKKLNRYGLTRWSEVVKSPG